MLGQVRDTTRYDSLEVCPFHAFRKATLMHNGPICTNSDTCRVCGKNATALWSGKLLDLTVSYFECETCGYVQTEYPYWLDRAYSHAINDSDTGIMARNLANARIVLATLIALG